MLIEPLLRPRLATIRSLLHPYAGKPCIVRHAQAAIVKRPQMVGPTFLAVISCLSIPARRLGIVLCHALTVLIGIADIVLGGGRTVRRRFPVPFERLDVVDRVGGPIGPADLVLCPLVSSVDGLVVPAQRLFAVGRDA